MVRPWRPWSARAGKGPVADALVLDTAGFLDLIVGNAEGRTVANAIRGQAIHVSDHCAAAVAQGLLLMTTQGFLSRRRLHSSIRLLAAAPFISHPAASLLEGAWARNDLRLGDALCVELSERLGMPLVTTDSRLATVWPNCWLISASGETAGAGSLRARTS
jgi:predicted nucleic acid-binding protein